jgi:hypothetical protein
MLPNGRHVVVRNGSHSFAGMSGCVDRIIAAFLETAAAERLDDSCVAGIQRPPFALPGVAAR